MNIQRQKIRKKKYFTKKNNNCKKSSLSTRLKHR